MGLLTTRSPHVSSRAPSHRRYQPTSGHLDPATAESFARTVNSLRGRATILFIAHQIPAGLIADRVLRLDAAGNASTRMGGA